MATKICGKGKKEKDLGQFHRHKNRKDGHGTWCRDCDSAYSVEYYHRFRQKRARQLRESKQRRREKDPRVAFSILLGRYKNRYELTVAEAVDLYQMDSRCFYCRIPLGPHQVSLDHKTPLCRGGSKNVGNIVVSCYDCNMLKDKRAASEFFSFIREYIKRFNGDDGAQATAHQGARAA